MRICETLEENEAQENFVFLGKETDFINPGGNICSGWELILSLIHIWEQIQALSFPGYKSIGFQVPYFFQALPHLENSPTISYSQGYYEDEMRHYV